MLIEPTVEEEIVRSLIDIWRHERFMPDGRSGNYNGRVCSQNICFPTECLAETFEFRFKAVQTQTIFLPMAMSKVYAAVSTGPTATQP